MNPNTKISTIDLFNNRIGRKGFSKITEALKLNTCLQCCDCWGNSFIECEMAVRHMITNSKQVVSVRMHVYVDVLVNGPFLTTQADWEAGRFLDIHTTQIDLFANRVYHSQQTAVLSRCLASAARYRNADAVKQILSVFLFAALKRDL
eukprot:c6278_g1_i3.p1 GENE.c6278_g1_i3~~c6278_g1_i3.p1  ORF type:complete len:148 (+),score=36.83 c6278_g1_i3:563-1006(+)